MARRMRLFISNDNGARLCFYGCKMCTYLQWYDYTVWVVNGKKIGDQSQRNATRWPLKCNIGNGYPQYLRSRVFTYVIISAFDVIIAVDFPGRKYYPSIYRDTCCRPIASVRVEWHGMLKVSRSKSKLGTTRNTEVSEARLKYFTHFPI